MDVRGLYEIVGFLLYAGLFTVSALTVKFRHDRALMCGSGQYMAIPGTPGSYLQFGAGQTFIKKCSHGLVFDLSDCVCNYPQGAAAFHAQHSSYGSNWQSVGPEPDDPYHPTKPSTNDSYYAVRPACSADADCRLGRVCQYPDTAQATCRMPMQPSYSEDDDSEDSVSEPGAETRTKGKSASTEEGFYFSDDSKPWPVPKKGDNKEAGKGPAKTEPYLSHDSKPWAAGKKAKTDPYLSHDSKPWAAGKKAKTDPYLSHDSKPWAEVKKAKGKKPSRRW